MKIDIQDKRELVAKIKNQDVSKTQAILAEALDLDVKVGEKKRQQKDESVRLELTQMILLCRSTFSATKFSL